MKTKYSQIKNDIISVRNAVRVVVKNAGFKKIEVTYADGSTRRIEISAEADDNIIKEQFPVGKVGMSGAGKYEKITATKFIK